MTSTLTRTLAALAIASAASLFAIAPIASASPTSASCNASGGCERWLGAEDAYAWEVGDDNADGVIVEDESGWVCSEMGNLICGPVAPQV